MSGHSHAKTVARTKEANAEKRGKIFSKLAKIISLAAKDGKDPASNSKLKQAIEESKKFNMPKENIERAIKRGTGESEEAQIEGVMYEAMGPGGVSIIIEGITDNKNRSLSEVRQILQKYNGKLAQEGSLKWLFEQKGIIIANLKLQNANWQNKENLEMAVIEAGADDIKWYKEESEETIEIISKPEDLETVKKNLEAQNIAVESTKLGWQAKEETAVSEKEKETLEKLFEELDENDTVQEIYSNLAS